MAARPNAWVCGRMFVGIAGSNHAGDVDVYVLWIWCVCVFVCGVPSSRGFCDGLVTRPQECYRVWVSECNCQASKMRRLRPS